MARAGWVFLYQMNLQLVFVSTCGLAQLLEELCYAKLAYYYYYFTVNLSAPARELACEASPHQGNEPYLS